MDNNIYKLLDYLAPTGVGIEKDIANPLIEIFGRFDRTDPNLKHTAGLLHLFLDYLIADNLLYIADRERYRSLGKEHPAGGLRWLDGEWPVGAAITLHGYDILSEEKARQKGTDLDSSVKKTNSATILNMIMTGALAFIVIILQIIANSREVKRDITQKEQLLRDSLQYKQQVERDISLQTSLDSIRQAILSLKKTSQDYIPPTSTKDTTQRK